MAQTPRIPKWVGVTVVWWGGRDWQFTNCVVCGEPLRSAQSIKNGYGPGCAKTSGVKSLVRMALSEERSRARDALSRGETPRPHNRQARRAVGAQSAAPTARQRHLLRRLANQRGIPYTPAVTRQQASERIDFLLSKPRK